MRTLAVILSLLLAACAVSPSRGIIERALVLPLGQTQELDAWLAANPNADFHTRADILGHICDAHARVGRYAEAARACRQEAEMLGGDIPEGLSQSIAFWSALADQPPLSVSGDFSMALTYGWSGMGQVQAEANGQRTAWGVDTGAEVSLLSASDAARFGVRFLGADIAVTGSTPGTAAGHLGMMDALRIGTARIEHVPVFVLPDESLTFEGNRLPPVLGMQTLYAFGAIAFTEHGARLTTNPTRAADTPGIAWNAAGISIPVNLPNGEARLHLDTGANTTEFNDSLRVFLTPQQRAALTRRRVTIGGVAGLIEREITELANLPIGVAGATCTPATISFGAETAGAQGRAGMNLVQACETLVLDFNTMQFGAR